jgi:hypothetical protein
VPKVFKVTLAQQELLELLELSVRLALQVPKVFRVTLVQQELRD